MVTPSDLEWERYEARLKMQRDISSAVTAARDEGRQQGLEQGRKEGLVGQIHFGQRLLQRPQTPAAQLLGLPVEELERLAQQLEAEVSRSALPPS